VAGIWHLLYRNTRVVIYTLGKEREQRGI